MSSRKNKKKKQIKIFLGLAIFAFSWVIYKIIFLPNGSEFAFSPPQITAMMQLVEKRDNQKIKYSFVNLSKISPEFRQAVLIAEDMDFPSHSGFSFSEIYNSIVQALYRFEFPRGASTISQQLAKNLYLSPSKNPLRKIEEAIITYKLERTLSKRRIFEIYLNIIELGPGVFGVEAASKYWFSKSASELSTAEAAKLAAIIPGPNSKFNPRKYPQRVTNRQQNLLDKLSLTRLPSGL